MFDGEAVGNHMVEIVKGYVCRQLKPLQKRIAELEAQLARVEEKGLAFRGIWQRASDYARGDIVTHAGTAWAATAAVKAGEKPGEGGPWQMMLKSRREAG